MFAASSARSLVEGPATDEVVPDRTMEKAMAAVLRRSRSGKQTDQAARSQGLVWPVVGALFWFHHLQR